MCGAISTRLGADDGKRRETAENDAWLPLEITFSIVGQSQLWQAASDCGERDLGLQFRQRCSQTEMNAVPEGDLPVLGAADVEPVGIGELVRIMVGCAEDSDEVLARRPSDA